MRWRKIWLSNSLDRIPLMLDTPERARPDQTKPEHAIDPSLLARFAAIVGDKYAITDPQMQAPYVVEMRDLFHGRTPLVLRPAFGR